MRVTKPGEKYCLLNYVRMQTFIISDNELQLYLTHVRT